MKKIGIICKHSKQEIFEVLNQLLSFLKSKQCKVFLDSSVSKISKEDFYSDETIISKSDWIIVLGGDGTILRTAHLIGKRIKPILGVNLGGLGFITNINKEQLFESVNNILTGKYSIQKREMIDAFVYRNSKIINNFVALNDMVVNRGVLARIIDIEIMINDFYVKTFKADGVIISTPIGSTAYSLAAGGPIIYPSMSCITITPICPHALTNRPIVLPSNFIIDIIIKSKGENIYLTIDGQSNLPLKKGDKIRIKKSRSITRFIIPFEFDYFNILRTKFQWGQR